jgi:predicted ABC-type ATPase
VSLMQAERTKDVVVIGGPNGAGKTTWAYRRLSPTLEIREFVNADEIARGISPLDPEASALAAGRLMLDRLNELVSAGHSFAFETTCSGRGHGRLLKRCRAVGYQITLIFLWLPSAEVALSRVARRISRGGHRIPDEVVVRRYSAGLRNMRNLYVPLADAVLIYDNSDASGDLIASRRQNESFVIHDKVRWGVIEEATR